MISAEDFISLLESKDLLDREIIADLRKRVSQSMAPVRATLLAKRLVDEGHLSRKLAQRLLDRAEELSKRRRSKQQQRQRLTRPKPADEDLELAPLEEEKGVSETADIEADEADDFGLELIEGDEAPGLAPLEPQQPPKPAPPPKPASPPKPAQPPKPARPVPPAPPAGSIPPAVALPVQPPPQAPVEGILAGGLESLLDDSLPQKAAGPLAPVGGKRRRWIPGRGRKSHQKRPARENIWDSPLLLVGGGALLFGVIVFCVLVFVLRGRGADEMLAQAEAYYRDGSYTKAIDTYAEYLERFPNKDGAGLAKVRQGLSCMRQATNAGNWPVALDVAQAEIQQISGEAEFAEEARPELRSILPAIAEGLANKAHAEQDSELVGLSEDALKLVEKYIPSSARPETKLSDIEALLALTRREIARGKRLCDTVDEMTKAAEGGQTRQGYQARRDLLKDYPVLFDDEGLAEAVLAVTLAEQKSVESIQRQQVAETSDPPRTALASLALARRAVGATVPGADDRIVFALAAGNAYALSAVDGRVLWRRPVGFAVGGTAPSFPPTPLSERPNADPLLVIAEKQELLRVSAADGQIRWRFAVGEPFDAQPVVSGNEILLATRSGKLISIDIESGTSAGYVQLPQPLRVGPMPDPRRQKTYQVGEYSSLFVVSTADGRCDQVVYLGHEPGSIIVAPVLIGRFLVVAENDGVNDATLRILAVQSESEDQPPVRLVQSIRLKGHVNTRPLVSGARMFVVTDQGTMYVFRVSVSDRSNPLTKDAEGTAASGQDVDSAALLRFPLLLGGRLWVADSRLSRYDVNAAKRRLQPRWIADEDSITLQPPVIVGDAVIHVRKKWDLPGVIVSAVGMEEGEAVWETTLAAGFTGDLLGAADETTAVTPVGAVYRMAAAMTGHGVLDASSAALKPGELQTPIASVEPLAGGWLALGYQGDSREIPIYAPLDQRAEFRSLILQDPVTCPSIAVGAGLVVPCRSGQVFWLDPRSGNSLAEPFQPRLRAADIRWSQPTPIGNDEFLLADSRGGFYRVGVAQQPKRHLAALAQRELTEPITSPIAVLGQTAFAVDASGALLSFELSDLSPKPPRPLAANCVWGPRSVGGYVLLATDDGLLYVVNGEGKVRTDTLLYGALAGTPAVAANHLVLASTNGVIWRVDPATGAEQGKIETAVRLATGVRIVGNRLVVGGYDGILYQFKTP